MPKSKPPYAAAFKQQIVELAMAGRTPAELAREFAISAQSVTAWIARAAADAGKPARGKEVLNSVERDELSRPPGLASSTWPWCSTRGAGAWWAGPSARR